MSSETAIVLGCQLITAVGILIGMAVSYIKSRNDRVELWTRVNARLDNCEQDITDLKHGRGLIISGGNWPDAVKRCFGFNHRGE